MGILDPMPNTKATRRPKSGKSRTSKIKPREESPKEKYRDEGSELGFGGGSAHWFM